MPANGNSVTGTKESCAEERGEIVIQLAREERRRVEPDKCDDVGGLKKSVKKMG
jgi:hypothetical protein